MSSPGSKIDDLLDRLRTENPITRVSPESMNSPGRHDIRRRPVLTLSTPGTPHMRRPQDLPFSKKPSNENLETDKKLREIMTTSGRLTINGITYVTDIKDLEQIEELGNGTCGHVIKMRHKPSGEIIAVKQMRRSGNTEENKRIIMDIEVVIKSHDCPYIVQCVGCFITEAEVWICMELMATCFDKLLKKLKQPIPEYVLGKVTVATVKALSYLKEKHGVIHRDVKPSNILLDERGNVKLCDFGISGRLVDSMAKTRSAGCAAYMAPERIEPDPKNPDYDIRADVWSLGITLVEMATGVFPYQDCKTDFEVLTKVIGQDPPILPTDKDFTPEFRRFVALCLIKDAKQRPKYAKLQHELFIQKYETAHVNVGEWFVIAMQQADVLAAKRAVPRHIPSFNSSRRQMFMQSRTDQLANGTSKFLHKPDHHIISSNIPIPADGRSYHASRISTFHDTNHQRETPFFHQRSPDHLNSFQQDRVTPPNLHRSYSPYRNYSAQVNNFNVQSSPPVPQKKLFDGQNSVTSSPYQQRRMLDENRWQSPVGSPLPLRSHIQNPPEQQYVGNTSPIVLQRFYHQQKQQQKVKEEEAAKEDPGKKRFSSYIKLQLNDRSGRSSRHQSPEPPPRLNRSICGDNQSPLTLRRTFLDSNLPGSPSFPRRYISPSPPTPPPRRLSESTSVPGSPQHLRARFHYTPEPQRHLFKNNDES